MLISKQSLKIALLVMVFSTTGYTVKANTLEQVGVVDRDKVVASYPKAQAAAEELKKSEDRVHKLIDDSNKQFDEAKTAKKPQAEVEGLQRRLQTQIDDEVKKVKKRAEELEMQLENAIDTAIKAEASSRKLDTVMVKQAVLLGGVDLTNGVIKRLVPGGGASPVTSANGSDKVKSKSAAK